MKKLFFTFITVFGFSAISHAGIFDSEEDRVRTVTYQVEVATAATAPVSTNTIIIDLSDRTNWPHSSTREIHITGINLEVDRVAASSGTLRIGVINYIGVSTGSVSWFYIKDFEKNVSGTNNTDTIDLTANPIKARVEGGTGSTNGTTPYLKTSHITSGSTAFQTDVALPSPNGNTLPGLGDIVMNILNKDAGNYIKATIMLQYLTPEN